MILLRSESPQRRLMVPGTCHAQRKAGSTSQDSAIGPKQLIQQQFKVHRDGVLARTKEVVARARLFN
eukprot:1855480-Amphidinium_carterae.1